MIKQFWIAAIVTMVVIMGAKVTAQADEVYPSSEQATPNTFYEYTD